MAVRTTVSRVVMNSEDDVSQREDTSESRESSHEIVVTFIPF